MDKMDNVENIESAKKMHEVLILGTNEQLIREIGEKTKGLVISDTKTFESVKQARTEIVTLRTSIDKCLKTANKVHRGHIAENNIKAEVLTVITAEYEEPLQAQVKNWQEKIADEKRIKAETEAVRVAAHTNAINVIRNLSVTHVNASIDQMQCIINHYSNLDITEVVFEEYAIEARQVLRQSLESLVTMQVAAKNSKAETDRQAEVQAQLDEQQKKLDEQREQLEADARKRKKIQDAEDKRLRVQREILEGQQREALQKQAEKERLEREKALRPDKENLFAFADQIRVLTGPDVDSDEAAFIIECALKGLHKVANIIHQQCENLK